MTTGWPIKNSCKSFGASEWGSSAPPILFTVELLTSTGDILRQWKQYFEHPLNSTVMSSIEEAEAGDSEVD